jgi:hypothetical protein
MGSIVSSSQVSEIEAHELPLHLPELLEKIAQFLDVQTFFSTLPSVCTCFRNLCKNNTLYEKFAFHGNKSIHSILQLYPEVQDIQELRYFRSDVNFHLHGIAQPVEIRIDVLTISNSKEVHLDEVSSMIIVLSTLNGTSNDVQIKALEFLRRLFETCPEKLKNLKLSGFRVNNSLLESLSKLHLDWLYLTCPLLDYFKYDSNSSLGFRRLHLKLRENCGLTQFPSLPTSLEELSLHITDQGKNNMFMFIDSCKSLKKM